MKKKLITVILCLLTLLPAFVFASFTQLNRFRLGDFKTTGPWSETFKDNGMKTKIVFDKHTHSHTSELFVRQDGKKIFTLDVTSVADNGLMITRIKNDSDNRIFYIVSGAEYGGFLIGFDPINKCWQKYADVKNYYSGLNADFAGINLKKGQINIYFVRTGPSPYPIHNYYLYWDKGSNWFGYEDDGIQYR